ncbi:hypothetical protein TNIN_309171 [Trichonephila inaurata madagascariensis]|uniref:Uncharacterized protein n=1 Tax=Trichonephila inaurata madagascariensis TaxID=2747483 RepID=A0A8X6XZ56_9ARAC|nr:hypothetical protein TNIN_309171 [Trichonephila inaurata madagascariensis]
MIYKRALTGAPTASKMRYNTDPPRCKCMSPCMFSSVCIVKKHTSPPSSSRRRPLPLSSTFWEDGEHIMKTLKSGDGAWRMTGRGDL